MQTPSIVPSLADLELALERAESRLARARYIDNYQRMVAEETAARREVEHFKAQIAAAASARPGDGFHCPLWPTCGCPDGAVAHDCPALQERP